MSSSTKKEGNGNTQGNAEMEAPQSADQQRVRKVNWDDSDMDISFANVVNVLNTREEFMLLFGTNRTWNASDAEELQVKLENRIVLTPHAAKRMLALLANRLQDYENRFGKIDI